MLRKPIFAVVVVLLSSGLARAQYTGPIANTGGFDDQQFYWNVLPSYKRRETPEDREIERRYRETLKTKIPDRKPASSDPWKSVRQTPAAVSYDRHRPQ